MASSDTYGRLTELVRDVLGNDDIEVGPGTTAQDVPGWDSLNHISIIVAVEVSFKIKFHTSELEDLKNVGELAALIERKRSGSKA